MILCFSGTGNSLYVAKMLAGHLNDKVIELKDELLLDRRLVCNGEPRLVWVFPIYSWGVPPVVKHYIQRVSLRGATGLGHYMVATCGDDAGLAHKQWRKLIKRRHWADIGAFTVQMPNNYTLMKGFDTDPAEVADLKMKAAPAVVKSIADDIAEQLIIDKAKKGRWAWIKSRVIYPWFVRNAMSPQPFHATEACNGCGLCAKSCPLENVMMWKHRPEWRDRCALCLRCYHICPQHAVAYGKATAGKGQYLCPAITTKELLAPPRN